MFGSLGQCSGWPSAMSVDQMDTLSSDVGFLELCPLEASHPISSYYLSCWEQWNRSAVGRTEMHCATTMNLPSGISVGKFCTDSSVRVVVPLSGRFPTSFVDCLSFFATMPMTMTRWSRNSTSYSPVTVAEERMK